MESSKFTPPRTFGELLDQPQLEGVGRCTFCKADGLPVFKYSTRHFACRCCIEPRRDQVLPKVLKREKFDALMRQVRAVGEAARVARGITAGLNRQRGIARTPALMLVALVALLVMRAYGALLAPAPAAAAVEHTIPARDPAAPAKSQALPFEVKGIALGAPFRATAIRRAFELSSCVTSTICSGQAWIGGEAVEVSIEADHHGKVGHIWAEFEPASFERLGYQLIEKYGKPDQSELKAYATTQGGSLGGRSLAWTSERGDWLQLEQLIDAAHGALSVSSKAYLDDQAAWAAAHHRSDL